MKTKYLFVCSVNRHRSRTADHFFSHRLAGSPYQFKSCGTDVYFINANKHYKDFKDSVPISLELVEWADVILCMENHHADTIKNLYGDEIRKKAYVLGIPDIYQYGSPELEVILENKVRFGLK